MTNRQTDTQNLPIIYRCEFEVDNAVDGKDIKEEETMEVVDIRMYHFSAEIVHLLIDKWISRNNFELIFL